MAAAMAHAREQGSKLLRLETYSCLEGARRLYARLGFALVDVEPGVNKFGRTFDRELWSLTLQSPVPYAAPGT